MRPMRFVFGALVLLGAAVPGSFADPATGRLLPLVVDPAWLVEHAADPQLVILHVATTRGEYQRGHIAGARFLWFYDLVQHTPEALTDLPPVNRIEEVLEKLGVGPDSRLVLCYSGSAFVSAARIFYTLDVHGLGDRTAILNGGLEGWKRAGRPVTEASPASPRPGKLTLRRRTECTMDAGAVKAHIGDPHVALVDARSKQSYDGTSKPPPLRPGHILGAGNLPVTQLTDSLGCVKNPPELASLFDAAGASAGKEVVAYCGVGQTASGVYFAARLLGMPVKLYDGSMDDWMYRDESYPVEVSPPGPPSRP